MRLFVGLVIRDDVFPANHLSYIMTPDAIIFL